MRLLRQAVLWVTVLVGVAVPLAWATRDDSIVIRDTFHDGSYVETQYTPTMKVIEERTYNRHGRMINLRYDSISGRRHSIDYDGETGEMLDHYITD